MDIGVLKRKSVVRDWLLSYICIMLIPILIGSSMYRGAMSTLQKEINRSNEAMMMQVQQTIDRRLQELERLSTEIAVNKQLENLTLASSPLKDDEQYQLVGMMKDLRNLKMVNEFVDQVYIYFKNSDTVLSTTNVEKSGNFFAHFKEYDKEYWNRLFQPRFVQYFEPVVHDLGSVGEASSVLYVRSLVPDYPDRPGTVLMFLIHHSKFLTDISDIPSVADGYVMILDQNNRIVADTRPSRESSLISYGSLPEKSGILYNSSSQRQDAVSYTTSAITGWKYVFVTPVKTFLKKMNDLRRLTYGVIALCVFIGGLAAFFFLRRNYGPVHLLLRQAADRHGIAVSMDKNSNEYTLIQAAIDNLAAEKNRMRLQLKEQYPAIKANLLVQLLRGRVHRTVPIHEALTAMDIHFQPTCFAVLLFTIENLGKLDSPIEDGQYNTRIQLVHFIITNVVEELARQKHQAYMVEIDDMLACVINGSRADSLREDWITRECKGIADQTRQFIWSNLQIHLTVAISGKKSALLDVPAAYEEALEATEYKLIIGGGEIIVYDEIRQESQWEESLGYYYPLSCEQKLLNYIASGDIEKSKSMADEIIEQNLSRQPYSVQLMKCLMAEMTGTLLKALADVKDWGQHDSIAAAKIGQLMECKSIKDMRVQLYALLETICSRHENDDGNELIEDVKRLVLEQFRDPSLNINVIGDMFRITPSYLARQFKNHTGEALLEFIQRTRLEQAKKLLQECDSSIHEIAKAVGFNEITTFNRTFKKYEGITPGQFRENH